MNVKKGFSLIELMVVVAIVAILAMVVYPSYMDSMRQSRSADAQAALQGLAQAMERFYTSNGTYVGAASAGVPTIFSTKTPIDGSDTYYNLTIQSATASAYELAATPDSGGPQAGEDTLTLKSTGERSW